MTKDPYRYFRIEAHELLEALHRGLADLGEGGDDERLRHLLRQAHTLKGAARVVKRTDIGDLAHEIEDLLAPHREHPESVTRGAVDGALALLDRVRALVSALDADPADDRPRAPISGRDGTETIRIPVRDLDALIEASFEAHAAAASLRREGARWAELAETVQAVVSANGPGGSTHSPAQLAEGLARARRALHERSERVLGELDELRALATQMRLVPAQALVAELEEGVRDAARTVDRDVALHAVGADTHVDAHVLSGLRKALVHVVRNGVAHGIEPRAERARAGKSPTGRIDLSIERRGHRLRVVCSDDGRGLDLGAVREVAVRRGLVASDAARDMDEAALVRLLLRGGVSTSRRVTGISGRGVGLDAVRDAVEALRGEVRLRSARGAGTTVEIVVPLSLSTMPALSVGVDDAAVLIPLDGIRRALRFARRDISRDAHGERVVVDGQVIPFFPLDRALDRPARERPAVQSAVVVEADGMLGAIGVDRIGAAQSVMVRNLPAHTAAPPIVSGACLDAEGRPQLVISAPALVRVAAEAKPEPVSERGPSTRLPLLVIDDSLTTRMLEQSILESAGFEVDLATSAEEGLERARARRYGVFIVDVEMPGMSGFEFVAKTRADSELRATPAILVTSRADPEDKRRGKDVGARAYIVKSEFDQAQLLETIRSLIG